MWSIYCLGGPSVLIIKARNLIFLLWESPYRQLHFGLFVVEIWEKISALWAETCEAPLTAFCHTKRGKCLRVLFRLRQTNVITSFVHLKKRIGNVCWHILTKKSEKIKKNWIYILGSKGEIIYFNKRITWITSFLHYTRHVSV